MSRISPQCWFLSAGVLVACTSLSLFPTARAQPAGKKTAKDIAKAWTYEPAQVGVSSQASEGSDKLYIIAIITSRGTFESAWNYYAKKCGSDKKYDSKKVNSAVSETKAGRYVILDQVADVLGQKSALFAYATEQYTVSVRISESTDKKDVYASITVALR